MSSDWPELPGATPIDPSGLKIESIRTRNQLCVAEAENVRKATVKYFAARPSEKTAPFSYCWLLRVHEEMFGDVWEWAGQLRTRELNIGAPWQQLGEQLGGLCLDIAAWVERADLLLEQAVTIHHRGVQIHPFENGNGRWARFLANVWLWRHGKSPIEWPEAELGQEASEIRNNYIAAVIEADEHNGQPLTELHQKYWPDA